MKQFSKLSSGLVAVLTVLYCFTLVRAKTCFEDAHPAKDAVYSHHSCNELTQRKMQTHYILCLAQNDFNMTIRVDVKNYEVMLNKANEFFNHTDFNRPFESIIEQNCSKDKLQPRNKYWSYRCHYNPRRIPQNNWFVECHHQDNPCRNKTISCLCNNTRRETSMCSDGTSRILQCTCPTGEPYCNTSYTIAQKWGKVYHKMTYLELENDECLDVDGRFSPMEVYMSNKWHLKQEWVPVACSCIEQAPQV